MSFMISEQIEEIPSRMDTFCHKIKTYLLCLHWQYPCNQHGTAKLSNGNAVPSACAAMYHTRQSVDVECNVLLKEVEDVEHETVRNENWVESNVLLKQVENVEHKTAMVEVGIEMEIDQKIQFSIKLAKKHIAPDKYYIFSYPNNSLSSLL